MRSTPSRSDPGPAASEGELLADLGKGSQSACRLPDFFLVGHAKCGTTALHQMLAAHPQIYMSAIKEPEFLSRAPSYYALRDEPAAPRVLPVTLAQYLRLFAAAPAGALAGEASTEYLRTPGTARRIAALSPQARIIAIFREPASFLRSLHLQLLQIGVEDERDFERAIGLEQERRRGRRLPPACPWPPALLYSDHVRYAEQLREYHDAFGRERVLALVYEEFRSDNLATLRQILRFLAVEETTSGIEPARANATLRVRSRRGADLINALAVGRGPAARTAKGVLRAVMPAGLRRRTHRAAVSMVVESAPRPPREAFMAELRARFRPQIAAASEELGRDLGALWGIDGEGGLA